MTKTNTYAIIDINDITSVDFSQVEQNSADTVRKSLDGLKFVLKWNVEPTFITDGSITPLQTLTHAECLALMSTAEWTEPIEQATKRRIISYYNMHAKTLAILYFLIGFALGISMLIAGKEIYVRLGGIFILIYLTYNVITQLKE